MRVRFVGAALAAIVSGPALQAQHSTPAPPPAYELSGAVVDDSRQPLSSVEILLIRNAAVVHTVLSGNSGRFTFGAVAAGSVMLHFRRLGYAAQTLELAIGPRGHPAISEIVLLEVPSQLAEITISAEPAEGRYRGYYDRKRQRASFARFLEHADVRRLGPANPSDLFRTVPGISIRSANLNGNTIRIRGCQPMVWVDGQRVLGAELDEVVQPSEIGAIEFYPSSAGVPAQYMERGNRLCGLILVWTR